MLRMGEYKKRRQQKEEVADRFARTQVGRQKGRFWSVLRH